MSGYQYLPRNKASHPRRRECEKIEVCVLFLLYLALIICPNVDVFCIVDVLGNFSEQISLIFLHPELSCRVSDLSAFKMADQNNVSEILVTTCLVSC